MGQRSGGERNGEQRSSGERSSGRRSGIEGGGTVVAERRTWRARFAPASSPRALAAALCASVVSASLGGCGAPVAVHDLFLGSDGQGGAQPVLTGFIGVAVADEPRAAIEARDVLARGGTAADAAVALAFTLAVTLPSRASLGAGGACLAYQPRDEGGRGAAAPGGAGPGPVIGTPQAIMFTPVAPAAPGSGADRPAAVPMLARGLFLLHTLYGARPFDSLITPAEQLARTGTPVSRAFAGDLAAVGTPLLRDPNTHAVFAAPAGGPLGEGALMVQPDLAATLAQLRQAGVGDLYQGVLAGRLVEGAAVAGGGLSAADLKAALPHRTAALVVPAGSDQVAFPPLPAEGGVAAAVAFQALQQSPQDLSGAQSRAMGAAAAARAGADARTVLAGRGGAGLSALPASTSFVVVDRHGGAVACALSMDNLFGTGRVAAGTGILLAASPATARPLLSAAIAWSPTLRAFRAAAGGSGQEGAPLAVAVALEAARRDQAMPVLVPQPGRANVVECTRYLPGAEGSCRWSADPHGSGMAAGSE